MREIKFRAWDKVDRRMVYIEGLFNRCPAGVDDLSEWMQYTGLKDKDDKEIYEGDIVVQEGYKWFDDGQPNYRGEVEWVYSEWQVVAYCVNPNKRGLSDGINEGLNDEGFDEGDRTDWEVIGNIHENPELLEV